MLMSLHASPMRRLLRRLLVVLSGLIGLPIVLLAAGTFVPTMPYLGTIGSLVVPLLAPQVAVVALLGAALAWAARRLGARRAGGAFVVLGLLGAFSAVIVVGRHLVVASSNGARIAVLATLVPRGFGAGAAPDATVAFAEVDGQELAVDIYRPSLPVGTLAPIVIYTHGGGWILGDRRMQAANLRWFADHGYLAISTQYVLATATRSTWNTASAHVTCAMAWVAANAPTYGGDPGRVFAFGESAGGALALTASYAAAGGTAMSSCGGEMPTVRAVAAEYPAVDPITFYENPDPLLGGTARQMVGEYLGGSPRDQPARAQAVASATYITPHAPPTLIFIPDNDHLVPIAGALQFIDQARRAGVRVQTVRFPWADHAVNFQYHGVTNQAMVQIMFQHFCRNGGRCTADERQ
jgi:acetyl esterase/lipase